MSELRECGYALLQQRQEEDGRLSGREYTIFENPIVVPPTDGLSDHRENRPSGKPTIGKSSYIVSIDNSKIDNSNIIKEDKGLFAEQPCLVLLPFLKIFGDQILTTQCPGQPSSKKLADWIAEYSGSYVQSQLEDFEKSLQNDIKKVKKIKNLSRTLNNWFSYKWIADPMERRIYEAFKIWREQNLASVFTFDLFATKSKSSLDRQGLAIVAENLRKMNSQNPLQYWEKILSSLNGSNKFWRAKRFATIATNIEDIIEKMESPTESNARGQKPKGAYVTSSSWMKS